MSEAQTESPPVTNRWFSYAWRGLLLGDIAPTSNAERTIEIKTEGETTFWRAVPPDGAVIEMAADGSLWRHQPRKTVQVFQSAPDPEADRLRIEAKQEAQFERHVIEWAKGQYLALFEAEPEAPASAAPVEEDDFPGPDEKLSDWDVVGVSASERGVLKTAMEDGESVSAAKRRLYPILNEELSRLQNQEALLGASTPDGVSARRKEVESLLGILARVGDA